MISHRTMKTTMIILFAVNPFSRGKKLFIRKTFIRFFIAILLISASSLTLKAQEIKKTSSSPNNSSAVVLRIKGLSDEKLTATVENVLNQYRGKILSHVMDINNNTVSVVISDKLQLTDLLDVLEANGIHAGYMNERNEYVGLDEDGELMEPVNINK